MTNEEAIKILEAYKQRLVNSVTIGLEEDIEAYDVAIKALNQTDGDLISIQAVIGIVEFECGEWKGLARTIVKAIEQLPSAEKTAEWISHEEDDLAINDYQCSKCDYWTEYNTKYCPNCGRRMKGAEE